MGTKLKWGILTCFSSLCIAGISFHSGNGGQNQNIFSFPLPSEGDQTRIANENEEDEEESLKLRRKLWYEAIHKAAPGTNWRTVERQNMLKAYNEKPIYKNGNPKVLVESFANGALQGDWVERGGTVFSGRVTACDYDKNSNKLFVMGDAGVLLRGVPDSSNWLALNNDLTFNNRVLKVIPNATGGIRILAAIGENIYYSDNDGATFTPSSGILFPVAWGGNYVAQIVSLNDANNTVYALTRPWDPAPWAARFWIYRSADRGQTFTKIHAFTESDDNRLSLWLPYNSINQIYALGNQDPGSTSTLYSISGSSVSVLNTSADLPVNVRCTFKGCKTTGTVLYALTDGNALFKSTNLGANWVFQSNLPADGNALGVSIQNPDQVSYGYVNAYRSSNAGISWTKVNDWFNYYGSEATKLHADMQDIAYFENSSGVEFGLVMNDGGIYRTDDYLVNNSNIGLDGLNISQFYDVKSEPNGNWVHCGAQDQGFQRSSGASGTVLVTTDQVISGDYGFLQLTGAIDNHLWIQYPGGKMSYFNDSHTGISKTYNLPGSNLPLYGWILPTARLFPINNNKILIVGGDITGGGGSYLVTLNALTALPIAITATQFNYDFRANSNGTAGLCAVETTPLDANKIYTATEDGSFFYSSDGGVNWTKNASFTGPNPNYLHGNAVFASRLTADVVYYAGSGYSNPPIYKSTDGGATFTASNTGLPDCTIFDLDANDSETLLFAATTAGPFVYMVSLDQWFPMKGTAAYCEYFSVEYMGAFDKVRFGTYGRGFWDFNITVQPLGVDQPEPTSVSNNSGIPHLYPNPAVANATIEFGNSIYYKEIVIFSCSGKLMKKINRGGQQKLVLDVSSFPTGLYFIKVNDADRIRVLKLVKM